MEMITDKFGISKMWKLTECISVFCVIMVLCIGCGQPNLDDPQVREKVLAEAIDLDTLQTRKSPSGEDLRYAPNQKKPYIGWVKSDSLDIINSLNVTEDMEEGIEDDIGDLVLMANMLGVDMELAQYQRGKLHGLYMSWWESDQQFFMRGSFLNSKMHGLLTIWHKNGQKGQGFLVETEDFMVG